MFEKFLSVEYRNFSQRYLNTFGFYVNRATNQNVLVQITDIGRTQVNFKDKYGMEYHLRADSSEDIGFSFIPPKSGWHNTPNGGVLIRRIPARQWQRGICSRNTQIMTPLSHRYEIDFDMLDKIFVNKTAFDQALAVFHKGSGSNTFIALSEQFALSYASKRIYCFDTYIGEWSKSGETYKVKLDVRELWQQEVRDAFARRNVKMELE